MYLSTNVLEEL